MSAHTATAAGAPGEAATPRAPTRALVGWVLFDWAAQPFYTLVLTFLFAPYFADVVVGDKVRGQAIWGYAAAAAGVLIAIGSPLLGAVADGQGRRKPWVFVCGLVLAGGAALLWWAIPAANAYTLTLVLIAFVAAWVAAEFCTVFVNSMMPTLVPRNELGRLSGIGWGVGYAGGLVSLVVMAGFIVANPATGKTFLGLNPILALDAGAREGDRLVGPFAAVWFLIFVVPFFLFVPDIRASTARPSQKSAFAELVSTIRALPDHPDMMLFLIARMLYADGLAAIFAFGGLYGSAVFDWSQFELGLFAIVLTMTGAVGAVFGGVLDDRIGAKKVIVTALLILLAGALGILSVTKEWIFFSVAVAPKAAGSGPFSSTGEHVFLGFAMMVALVAAPVQASSRSLLARLAPAEKMAQFFGLFAFSGKATAFLAPFLVAAVTAMTGSHRASMAVIAGFLIAGLLLILPVREQGRIR
ncbi:MAG: MFS transporter [Hyphomicrobiaceae bacterium]